MESQEPQAATSAPPAPAPARRPVALALFFLLGAALSLLAAVSLGALTLRGTSGDLDAGVRGWVAAGVALGLALVVPSAIAWKTHVHALSATRIFAGWNLVIALALVVFVPSAMAQALREHASWPFSLMGVQTPAWWQDGADLLAAALPGREEASVAGAPAVLDADPAAPAPSGPLHAKEIFTLAKDSVVFIGVRRGLPEDGFEALIAGMLGLKEVEGHGSGFVVSPDGLIVTNHHVIDGAASAYVRFVDGRRIAEVEILASDPANDLALLRVKADGLKPVAFAGSDEVDVGATAFAIGSPLGLDFTLTSGIVSARREQQSTSFLQMQTTIAPGSSGGPVLDDQGRLIGVSTATRGAGLNLAVHARHVRDLREREQEAVALARWRSTLELRAMDIEGVDALPTVRAQMEQVATLLAKSVEGCMKEVPEGGAKVQLVLDQVLGGEPRLTSNLGEEAKECLERTSLMAGMQLSMVLAQSGAKDAALTCVFEGSREEGDEGPGARVELAIRAGDPPSKPPATADGGAAP